MENRMNRRKLMSGAAVTGLVLLSGCASLPGFSLTEAIKRLLTISSQNAFAALVQENGFFASDVARLSVPDSIGGARAASIASAVLRSKPIQDRLLKQVNRAAEKGAELAAPLVADAIRNISIADAAAIVNGDGRAATGLLQREMGTALVSGMLPGISNGLKLFDDDIISLVLSQVSGVNLAGLSRDVTEGASNAIYRAIGAEEERIRANPQSTGDPLLIAIFGLSR